MRINPLITIIMAVITWTATITIQPQLSAAQSEDEKKPDSMEARLRRLEDTEAIRRLLIEYGRTLDAKNFDGFSKLFAQNAEYIGGASMGVTKGPLAIRKLLEDIIKENPTGFRSPNFHLFTNAIIQVNGDEATALSKGAFVVPGKNNTPEIVMLATYNDLLIRENGIWKFKRREVHTEIPAAP